MAKETQNNALTVTLADGTQLTGLALNGNNFISKTEISKDTFNGKLSRVTITGDAGKDEAGLIGEHTNMELVRCEHDAGLGGWAIVLRNISEAELAMAKLKSDVAYTAMMSGVDLDD